MSRATDELRADHAIVTVGLSVLRAIGEHVRAGGAFPAQDTAQALRFLREFLVATHFRKENEVVWPAVALRASETSAATVGKLVLAQDEATQLISTLVVFWEPVGELTEDERHGFADTIDTLELAVSRMQDTEERLFHDCDANVPPDDQLDWPQQFAAFGSGRDSRATWEERLRHLAATWR